jgi:hypothetical protein
MCLCICKSSRMSISLEPRRIHSICIQNEIDMPSKDSSKRGIDTTPDGVSGREYDSILA